MDVVTRLYDSYGAAREAVAAVERLHLTGVEASLLGNESLNDLHAGYDSSAEGVSGAATGAGVGAALGGGAGLLAGLGMLAIPGIGPIVAAGWLAATAVGAVAGGLAGGALGTLADIGIPEEDVPLYGEALRRGNVAVSVRTPTEHRIAVENALETVNPHHVDALRARYEADGWRAETAQERAARETHIPPYL